MKKITICIFLCIEIFYIFIVSAFNMGDSCIIPDSYVRFRDGFKTKSLGRCLDTEQNSWLKSMLLKEALTVETGDYEIWVYQHSDDLVRGQIHSRHRSQTKYNVWIQFDVTDYEDPVKSYYCICPAGKRTSGMCAQISSILYYLGHHMHMDNPKPLQPVCSKFKDSILK